MPLRLTNLELPVEEPEELLAELIARRLGVAVREISAWRILRKSLDARSRDSLRFVYTVSVAWPGEEEWLKSHSQDRAVERFNPPVFDEPVSGSQALEERPVVVGSGPGGLLAAYCLAIRGYQPLVLERGDPVKERVGAIRDFDRGGPHDPENNYLFGEGGAGTFSDGKLTCRMSGSDVDWVLEQFVECGGKPEIRYEQRPHLGSNRLPMLVRNFRRRIEALGGEYRFRCRMEDLDVRDGIVRGVGTSSGYLKTSVVVLAIGHSARDTYEMLHRRGVPMQPKAFQLGLRIEQPQEQVNHHKYGRGEYAKILGAADYTLIRRIHVLHVCRRRHHSQCLGAGNVLHERHEQLAARHEVCQQRRDGDARPAGIRQRTSTGGSGAAAALRTSRLQARARRLSGSDPERL
jgi:uncharacterized protein